MDALSRLYFNSDRETNPSEDSETQTSGKHEVLDDEMVSFGNKAFKYLQNLHFQSKIINFVSIFIPSFDLKKS